MNTDEMITTIDYIRDLAPDAEVWAQEQIAEDLDQRDAEIKQLKDQIAIAQDWLQETEAKNERLKGLTMANARLLTQVVDQIEEIGQLDGVIDRAAKALMSLEPQVAWEGDVADAMAAGVAEINRMREALDDASKALDLAQSLLERSAHHARILGAYERTRAALAGNGDKT